MRPAALRESLFVGHAPRIHDASDVGIGTPPQINVWVNDFARNGALAAVTSCLSGVRLIIEHLIVNGASIDQSDVLADK